MHPMNMRPLRHTKLPVPRLFSRQKALLAFLDAHDGRLANRDLQKLLFLYCKELRTPPPFDFVPYRYGAFSFLSYADRRKLIQLKLIANQDSDWVLTSDGQSIVRTIADPLMIAFAARYRDLRGDSLVAETYRRFPFYAVHSIIKSRVLRGDQDTLLAIEHSVPSTRGIPPLVTIGYEGRTIDRFLTVLLRAGVTLLCDVRRNPVSRKYGFSKKTLKHACEAIHIRYEHLPRLGIPSELRHNLHSQAQYDQLFRAYESDSLSNEGESILRISTWIQSTPCVALVCFERHPEQCHRRVVAKAVEARTAPPFEVAHL